MRRSEFFNRSTRNLTEELSGYAPSEGMMTLAQQVAHVAQTVDWFLEGAFRPEGFSMNFDEMAKESMAYTSLAAARALFEKAIDSAKAIIAAKSDEELLAPLPAGPIMGGLPSFRRCRTWICRIGWHFVTCGFAPSEVEACAKTAPGSSSEGRVKNVEHMSGSGCDTTQDHPPK